MHKQDHIQLLEKIKRVKPPPFLYTRIETKIEQWQQNYTPLKWVAISASAFCLLLIINLAILNMHYTNMGNEQSIEYFAEKIHLITTNQFYYE